MFVQTYKKIYKKPIWGKVTVDVAVKLTSLIRQKQPPGGVL